MSNPSIYFKSIVRTRACRACRACQACLRIYFYHFIIIIIIITIIIDEPWCQNSTELHRYGRTYDPIGMAITASKFAFSGLNGPIGMAITASKIPFSSDTKNRDVRTLQNSIVNSIVTGKNHEQP
jgi:hypothetical protein